jgi:hypothetical protein
VVNEPVAEPQAAVGIAVTERSGVTTVNGIVLGPRGIDDLGRAGRLHTVARGDTLWDLAAGYLGTPWVWPSVWIDNQDIANPHRIDPGDKIWITANEMRVVSDAEAESFLALADAEMAAPAMPEDMPASEGTPSDDAVAALDAEDEPSTLDAFPMAIPGLQMQAAMGRQISTTLLEVMGFVTAEDLAGASTIVGSSNERNWLAAGDDVVLGLGEGDVEIGDEFTIFDVIEDVRDPETRRLLGHHVRPLGWAEVKELTGDTSLGEIRMSYAEIARGTRIMRREPPPHAVEMLSTPDATEGIIVFLPLEKTMMGGGGYVFINRGEFHGVEPGSALEVFESGKIVVDSARRVDVRTPDHIVARLVVVSVQAESAVAFVLAAERELHVGERIRPFVPSLAQR